MARFPHGGEVLGAAPANPLLAPVLRPGRDLNRQQALLDLQAIQRIPGLAGYWPADPAYLYEDSAGTIPASINGVVGCVRNVLAAPVYTPVTIANPGFASDSDWTKGTGWTIADGVATKAAGTASVLAQAVSLVAGATYVLSWTMTRSAGTLTPRFIGGTTNTGTGMALSGTYEENFVATTGNATLEFSADASFAGTVDNITLISVSNAPALQATTAVKPYLRKTPRSGVYWLDSNTSTSALTVALSDTVLGRRNLLTYSEDISNAAWGKSNVTVSGTTITASGTAYNAIFRNFSTLLTAAPVSCSFEAKAGTKAVVRFDANAALTGSADVPANFNLSTGALGTVGAGLSATMTAVGEGWYRCSVSWTRVGALTANGIIAMADSDTSAFGATSTAGTLQIRNIQLELGATATDYQRIVSAPAYCTVARATAEGVTITENSEITPSYNIAPAFGFNGDIAIFNRALTATEKALVTRHMQRGVPVLGAERLANNTFDADLSGWTYAGYDASNYVTWGAPGVARYQLASVSPVATLSQSGVIASGQPYLIKLSVSAAASGSVQVTGFGATGVAHTPATAGITTQARYASIANVLMYRSIVPADVSVDSISVRPIL